MWVWASAVDRLYQIMFRGLVVTTTTDHLLSVFDATLARRPVASSSSRCDPTRWNLPGARLGVG